MIPLLAPVFQGDWAPYGETLACVAQPPQDALQVADLLRAPPLLADVLRRHAQHLGTRDLRPVASAWSLDYLWALLPPAVAAASLLQHEFPLHPDSMWLTLDKGAQPLRFTIADEGRPRPGSTTAARYDMLLGAHLQPLFAALGAAAGLAPRVLWGNAARYLDTLLEQIVMLAGDAPRVAEDREQLLGLPTWPDGRRNLLYGQRRVIMRIENGRAIPIKLHRQCCLYHRLPGREFCGACPLAPEHCRVSDIATNA